MADFHIGGHAVPKWAAFTGIGVIVVGGVLYFRHENAGSSGAAASSDQSGTDPVTGLPYSEDQQIDPATGLTYLSEAQQYGSVAAAEAAVGAGYGGVSDDTEGYSGDAYGEPTSGYQTTDTEPAYATNAEWAAAVQAALPAITGDSASNVATAIANYLANLPQATTQEASDMQVALAEFGPPPTGTFSVIAPSSSSGTTGTGSPSSGGSGASTGTSSSSPAGGPITAVPSNFRVTGVNGLKISLAWDAVQVPAGQGPLAGYTVAYGQSASDTPYQVSVGPGTTSTTVTFNSGAGSNGLTHYFTVWARPASPGGPHAGPISAKTQ